MQQNLTTNLEKIVRESYEVSKIVRLETKNNEQKTTGHILHGPVSYFSESG